MMSLYRDFNETDSLMSLFPSIQDHEWDFMRFFEGF